MYTVTAEPYYTDPSTGSILPATTNMDESSGYASTEDLCKFSHIFLAGALAGGAGIRSTAPLFILSICNLTDPKEYPLSNSARWLGHEEVCIGLGLLLLLEILADQIPAVDHALHAILTPAHPVAGAIAAIAPNYCGGAFVRAPMAFIGASTALSVHAGKALIRGGSTGLSCGMCNPFISIFETILTFLLIGVAIAVPAAAVVVAVVFCIGGVAGLESMRRTCGRTLGDDEDVEASGSEDEDQRLQQENRRLQSRLQMQQENQRLREQLAIPAGGQPALAAPPRGNVRVLQHTVTQHTVMAVQSGGGLE